MRLLNQCIIPQNADIEYLLVIGPSTFEIPDVPSWPNHSACRNFYRFLYKTGVGYERAKQNINKHNFFVVEDEVENLVFIIVKDSSFDNEEVLDHARRVYMPLPMKRLLETKNYKPYVHGLIGTAAVAGGLGLAYRFTHKQSDRGREENFIGGLEDLLITKLTPQIKTVTPTPAATPKELDEVKSPFKKAAPTPSAAPKKVKTPQSKKVEDEVKLVEPPQFFVGSNVSPSFDAKDFDVDVCILEGNYTSTIMLTLAFYYFKIMTNSMRAGVFLNQNYINMPWFEPAKRGQNHEATKLEFYRQLDKFINSIPDDSHIAASLLILNGHACMLIMDAKEKRLEFYDPNGREAVYTVGQVNPATDTAYSYFERNRRTLAEKYGDKFNKIWSPTHSFQNEKASCGLWSSVLAMYRMAGVPRNCLTKDIHKIVAISSDVRTLLYNTCDFKKFVKEKTTAQMFDEALFKCKVPENERKRVCGLTTFEDVAYDIPKDVIMTAGHVTYKPTIETPDIIFVSGDAPHTFWIASPNQKQAMEKIAVAMSDDTTVFPHRVTITKNGETYRFDMYVGWLDKSDRFNVKIYIQIGEQTTSYNIWGQENGQNAPDLNTLPQVYCYQNDYQKWRYFRSDKEGVPLKWNEGQYIDSTAYVKPEGEFSRAYDACVSCISDFKGVKVLHNIFAEVEGISHHHARQTARQNTIEMMNSSCVLHSRYIEVILTKVLGAIQKSDHAVSGIYKKLGSWRQLMERLLTKRVLWYYNDNYFGSYLNGKLRSGSGDEYLKFIQSRMGSFLHPDEAVVSSLLGLKVPCFAYDDGRWSNKCQQQYKRLDKKVIMLAQVGARLEPYVGDKHGDRFLLSGKAETPFQKAVAQKLKDINQNLYIARCHLILEQSIMCAVNHDTATHLILTGLGQGNWAGTNKLARNREYSQALLSVLQNVPKKQNLNRLTIMDYGVPGDLVQSIQTKCQELGITFELKDYESPIFEFGQDVDMYSFAWDGMSLVGNEYYTSPDIKSADPAAACSTSIAFMSHPKINPEMYKRVEGEF